METRKLMDIIVLLGIFILFSGCLKDEIILKDPQKFNRPLNLAAPVFNAHFQAIDLIDRMDSTQFIFIDDEGLIHVRVDTAFSVGYEDVIEFDELGLDIGYDIGSIKKSTKATFVFSDTIPAAVIEDQRFDSLTIETAQMEVSVTSPNGFTGSFVLVFPEITLANGDTLKFENTLGGTYTDSEDLADGTLRFFQNSADISSFKIVTLVDATASGIPTNTELRVTINMLNFKPGVVLGYFGRMNIIEQKEEMEFDFFEDFDFTEMIQFKDVNLLMGIKSYFGIPVSVNLDSMVFTNSSTGETRELEKSVIRVGAATYGNPVIPSQDSITMDLADAINIAPDKIYYEVNGWVNPDGDLGNQNFLINGGTSTLETEIRIEIPFWFKTDNYRRTDTINLDIRDIIEDSTTIDYLEQLNLYFDFINGFPFSIYAQAYMVDAQGIVIDSLFSGDELIWESPAIDADGKAGEPIKSEVNINIDHEKAKKLYDKHVTQIFIDSRVKSGGTAQNPDTPTFVKLFSDYTIDISLAIDVKSGELSY